jgi:hypothetical protein
MNDEILSNMDTEELELFLSVCAEEAEKLNVSIDYYIAEFVP